MRRLFLFLACLCAPAFGQATLEDWSCYQIVNAVSAGGGKTNLTCNAAHGYSTGTAFIVYGATGAWTPLDTQIYNRMANLLPVSATDTKIQVNDTRYMVVPGFVQLDAEYMYVTSVDSDYLYIGPGAGCATGRGCRGSRATKHAAQQVGGWVVNANPGTPLNWIATAIDSTTLQINLDSSTFGSFTGQTVFIRRAQNAGTASPLGQVYLGQPWASYDEVIAEGLKITVPACTVPSNAFLCAKGFLTIASTKGYSFNPGGIAISSFVISGTAPNQIATVTFTSGYTQPTDAGANTLRTVSTAASWGYAGSLLYIDGMDETATGLNSLNRPYMIQSLTTIGSKVTQVVLAMNDSPAAVPNGSYGAGTSSTFACSSRPCAAIPWPGDPYTDFNLPSAAYPNGTLQQYLKYGANWNSAYNRLRVKYKWDGITQGPLANGAPPMDLGGYIKHGTDPSDSAHTYQDAGGPIVSGQWGQMDWTAMWEHIVGVNNDYLFPYEAMLNGGWYDGSSWAGGVRPFWQSMGRIYWDWSGPPPTTHPMTGGSITYRSITLDQASGDSYEYAHGTGIAYDGTKYQLGWTGPRQNYAPMGWQLPVAYNVAYSTSDLRTIGFSNGTSGGSISNSAGNGDTISYSSPAMSSASTIYFGIRPVAPIYAASPNGSSPIWFWSWADYWMDNTSHVTTSGVGGTGNVTNAAVSSVRRRQFWTVTQAASNPPWATPGMLTSITSDAAGHCTVHLNGVNHNLSVGWPVLISNPPASTLFGNNNTSGVFVVTSTPTANTFVFSCPSATANTTWNKDLFDSPYWHHFTVMSLPGVSVAGTASGISPSSATMVATDDTKNFTQIAFTPASVSAAPLTGNPCDLNGDGVVNRTDYDISVAMALGQTACNGGLRGLGTCNVVDTQRVSNAANGGNCRTGQ